MKTPLIKGQICQANILDIDEECQSKKLYGEEESEVARFCLSLLIVGAKKTVVQQLAQPIKQENFKKFWKNLQANEYFNADKTIDIELGDNDISFILMMQCAMGQLERRETEET